MPTRINVPCKGGHTVHTVRKAKDTIVFGTSGNCKFTSFKFVPDDPPPGFGPRQPPSGSGDTVSYEYDGRAIPTDGYTFQYATDSPPLGNGTGVIKN
jgi:hypothetical protein